MLKYKLLSIASLVLVAALSLAPSAFAQSAVCTVGDVEYESINTAVEAVMTGEATGDILLLSDCELDVGTITAPVTIDGAGHSLSVPAQRSSENGALNILSRLRFKNTIVAFANFKNWSAVIGGTGSLELLDGSDCSFAICGIYASPGAAVTVDASKMSLEDMKYTCMMGEAYALLNVQNGSEFRISSPVEINGVTGFNITVDNSRFTVNDCQRQGLVKCSLSLENGAVADISGNGYGYNLYSYNALNVNSGALLKMNGNSNAAIFMQGRSSVTIKAGGSFLCSENGGSWGAQQSDADYGSKAAIDIGWFNAQYIYKTGSFSIEDGAVGRICNNYSRAISNYGTVYLGSGSVIRDNGALLEGETADRRRIQRGGGILNSGTMVLSEGAQLYGNHASQAGDDLYNAPDASLSLPPVGSGWVLSLDPGTKDCGHAIDGWYQDNTDRRWNAHDIPLLHISETAPGDYASQLEIKAAHGVLKAPQTGDGGSLIPWSAGLFLSLVAFSLVMRRLRRL